jgi:hypothetical protein
MYRKIKIKNSILAGIINKINDTSVLGRQIGTRAILQNVVLVRLADRSSTIGQFATLFGN